MSAAPSATITIPDQKTTPTYRLRTMAGDIEAAKKGEVPQHSAITIEVPKAAPPPSVGAVKESPAAVVPEPPRVKPAFPQLPQEEKTAKSPVPPVGEIKPSMETLAPSRQFAARPPEPFSGPIKQPVFPVPKPEPTSRSLDKNSMASQAPPPPNLPSAPLPPKPLTPPPPPRPMPSPPPPSWPFSRPTPPPPVGPAPQAMPPLLPPLPSVPPTRPTPPPLLPLPTMPQLRSGPALPPLPPKPGSVAFPPAGGRSKKKLILMAAVGVVVVLFILAEMWWFFLREEPSPVTPGAPQELLPPPQPLQPLLPEPPAAEMGSMGASAPLEAALPEALLAYARTEVVAAESPKPSDIASAGRGFDFESLAEGELVRIVLKAAPAPEEGAAAESPSVPMVVGLNELLRALGLKAPTGVSAELGDDYDFFAHGADSFDQDECEKKKVESRDCYGARLGLAVRVLDPVKLASALKLWEKTMAADLRPLILAKPSGTGGAFQTGTYRGQTIRYKNMPIHTITVDYALRGDLLLIATSKSSMLKAIDALLAAPAK